MPRLVNLTPKYRKHRASGQAIVTLNGKDHYLGPYGSKVSKNLYDRLVGEWMAAGRQRPLPQGEDLTVIELIAAYAKWARGYYRRNGKPTSEVESIALSLRSVKALYGREPCSSFGPLALEAVREKMIGDGLARKVINQRIRRVCRMFKWGVAKQKIPASIYRALKCVEGLQAGRTQAHETAPIQPADDALIDATLPHMPEVVADMVRLQRLTGMRAAELVILRPQDIDRSGEVWEFKPASHKTMHHGKQRVIYLGPQSQAILLRYLARDPAAYCFRPCDSEAKRRAAAHAARKVPMSCGNRPGSNQKRKRTRQPGEQYTSHSYYYAIRRGCDKAFPVPDEIADDSAAVAKWRKEHRWTPLQVRHAVGTDVRRQFGLEAAQIALGHARADVTQVYAERDRALGVRVAKEVG